MRTSCLIIVIAFFGLARSSAEEPEVDWFATDKTGLLEQLIADYIVNYEKVHAQRHAFVCRGEHVYVSRGKPVLHDIGFIAYQNNKGISLFANYETHQSNIRGDYESWTQQLMFRGVLHRRGGPLSGDLQASLQDEDEINEATGQFIRFDPIDMALSVYGNAVKAGPEKANYSRLTVGKLVSAQHDDNGDVLQVIEQTGTQYPFRILVRWKKRGLFFPSQVQLNSLNQQSGKTIEVPSAVTLTDWVKHGEVILPSKLSIVDLRNVQRSAEMELRVEYRLENELPPDPFITPGMPDWREPIRSVFDEQWLRRRSPDR